MNRTLAAASVLLAALGMPLSAIADSPPEAGQCFSDYKLSEEVIASYPDLWGFAGGTVDENFNERLFRSGQAMTTSQRGEADQAAFNAILELDVFGAPDASLQTIADLHDRSVACDAGLKVPASAIQAPAVEDLECAIRYATMSIGYQIPAQKAYFNKRMRLGIERDAYHLGMKAVDPTVQQDVAAAALPRAQANFGADGQPVFASLHKSFLDVQACDRQYALPLTQIPQQVTDGASGKAAH